MTNLFQVILEENFYYPHVIGEVLTDAFRAQGNVDQIILSPIHLSLCSSYKDIKHYPLLQTGHIHIFPPQGSNQEFPYLVILSSVLTQNSCYIYVIDQVLHFSGSLEIP